MLSVQDLRCENQREVLGLDETHPRFSWLLSTDGKNVLQAAYQLQVAVDPDFHNPVMDSGRCESDQSVLVEYEGEALQYSTRYWFRVKVEDNHSELSPWSEVSWFETGLLGETWSAPIISPYDEIKPRRSPGWYLERNVELEKKIGSARLYATAQGLYELSVNGEPAGDNVLAPGWTNYDKRLLYQTYDVTGLLKIGTNHLRGHLGAGWYKGDLMGGRNFFGKRNAFSAFLLVRFADGEERRIFSDGDWSSRPSPVLYSEIYHGEIYDARQEVSGSSVSRGVDILPIDPEIVTGQDGPLIRRQEILPVQQIIQTPRGETVLDFGQNLTGWVRFRTRGSAGSKVRLKHGEVLDRKGNFYTKNLRKARQEISYVLNGEGEESFEPHFTFQGFRYVRVLEWPGNLENLQPEDFDAVVVHSELESRGTFSCSSELVNRLHRNIEWGMKGNFLDVPTDCPQRDERLGWTGDAQAFIGTAQYLKNTDAFFRKWLRDLRSEQRDDGAIPHVIPDVLARKGRRNILDPFNPFHSAAGWADAAVICPWEAYRSFGDRRFLEEQYSTMTQWISWIEAHADGGVLWSKGHQYGDWLALDRKNERSCSGATPNDFTATAFFAHSVNLCTRAAEILGKDADRKRYSELHLRILEAFRKRFVTPGGSLTVRTQTAHVLAMQFRLVPDDMRSRLLDDLVQLIDQKGHLTTGFLGTPYLNRVLAAEGRSDVAARLLLREEYPSWLYPIKNGATTVWESWDSIKPDGSFQRVAMNSFNHYAFGAVGQYLYEAVAGISTLEPGFKSFLIKPHVGEGLHNAEADFASPYGVIAVRWNLENDRLSLAVTIPPNTNAFVYFPKGPGFFSQKPLRLGSGRYDWSYEYGEAQ